MIVEIISKVGKGFETIYHGVLSISVEFNDSYYILKLDDGTKVEVETETYFLRVCY